MVLLFYQLNNFYYLLSGEIPSNMLYSFVSTTITIKWCCQQFLLTLIFTYLKLKFEGWKLRRLSHEPLDISILYLFQGGRNILTDKYLYKMASFSINRIMMRKKMNPTTTFIHYAQKIIAVWQ